MISYELSYGLALASVLVMANSLSLTDIVNRAVGQLARVHPALVRVRAAARVSSST